VLVVDDDPDIREALRDTLEQEGYCVAEATDGSAALSYLRSSPPPPLILLDWNMAPMNAAAFMEEFSREPAYAQIPVVLLTADVKADERAKAIRCAGYLTKPVTLDALFETVARYCR